jgi:hypothetical protein
VGLPKATRQNGHAQSRAQGREAQSLAQISAAYGVRQIIPDENEFFLFFLIEVTFSSPRHAASLA